MLLKFPLSRLSLHRRIPFWAQALALCALFAIVGVAVLDDYGMPGDEVVHREIAIANAEYIATGSTDLLLYRKDYRYHGVAFDISLLLLVERVFGLQDSRDIYLTRHLVMHLFFIAGGFVCGMLAYRMLGSRWIALLAMLMFLLHPRLYAHSFFDIKDISFTVVVLIALYLTHRAFRRDTLGAFLMCGIVVGLAMNMRPFGLMLLPMIPAMRGLDLWQAGGGERKRILASIWVFAAAALAIIYIVHPYYWENPLRLIDGLRVLSQHPTVRPDLFMGEIYRNDAVPWNYIPVWFAITAPPVALLLGAIGCAAVFRHAITRPIAALRDRETRFRVLLLGCFALPVPVVIALQANFYDSWRHMYFLWAPFCLLTAVGLRALASGGVAARLPGWVRGGALRQSLAYGVAGFGLLTTATAMVELRPYQYVYFNALVDTNTPGALVKRYEMDYWALTGRQTMEHLLARYPDDTLRVWPKRDWFLHILPQKDRDRLITLKNPHAADFYVLIERRRDELIRRPWRMARYYLHPRIDLMGIQDQPSLHSIRAYGGVIASIVAKDVEAYRAAYDDVAANGTPLAHSTFDIYAWDDALYYLNANCARRPMSNAAADWIFLHIFPADPGDLPVASRERGFENLDFRLDERGAFFDGKCIHRQPLPDYPIARIRTGQFVSGNAVWRADINLAAHAATHGTHARILAGDYGPPVAQSHFDLYLHDNALTYLKSPCAPADTNARFFLHITPANPADLPTAARELGFANLDFQFTDHGAHIGDNCVATRDLPPYPIDRIRTGQFVSGKGRVWIAEFPAAQ